MTQREWRRQGGFLVFVICSLIAAESLFSAKALAANETKTDAFEKTSLISKLMSKESMIAKTPAAEKPVAVKKVAKKADLQLESMSDEDKKAEGEIKTIKGRVSGVNNFGIAVEYGDDPKLGAMEMWATLMKDTKLEGVKKFKDFQMGDAVELTYKELKKSPKRFLQKIKLIRRAPKELEAVEADLGAV